MINYELPIIPWKEIAGIKLYSTIFELREIINNRKTKAYLLNNLWIRYEIENKLYLFFNLINGKLFKITALSEYKGKLFNTIYIGMDENELLKHDKTFIYDEFEEVYDSKVKGVFIETDPETHKIHEISIYIKEIENENFDEGTW